MGIKNFIGGTTFSAPYATLAFGVKKVVEPIPYQAEA
jgi:hypothetical protein